MLLKRERLLVYASLAALVVLAWISLLSLSARMQKMGMVMQMSMPVTQPSTPGDFPLVFAMWAVMMVAMMVPSAAPMILMYDRLRTQRFPQSPSLPGTLVFILGYLATWAGFSLVAALAQGVLHDRALLSPQLTSASPYLGGALLVAAGIYQFLPVKTVCLNRCRTPLGFLLSSWRDGVSGAFRMGMQHGVFCLGCCWLIMALLFVGGVMNLAWVAILSIYILLEKITPPGSWAPRVAGILAMGWGLWMIAGAMRM